jgi:rifampicin phosphotransferase
VTAALWAAPGPGQWRCSDALVAGAVTPYLRPLYIAGLDAGSRTAFRRYGLPLDGFDFALVGGRIYRRVRPVVPAFGPAFLAGFRPLVRGLFALHPELRRRRRRAAAALAGQEWRAEIELWRRELAGELRRANLALQEVDPRALDDGALGEHVDRATRLLQRGTEVHFQQGVAWSYPVGDWLRRTCAWTGVSPALALAVLRGSSPATTAPRDPLRRLAAAVAEVPAARAALGTPAGDVGSGGPAEQLAALRASAPRVARELDAYLGEHGDRLVTGYDLADRTLRELPWAVVRSIARQLTAEPEAAQPDTAAAGRLRDAVPAASREAWDRAFQEAVVAYGFREEEVGATYLWPAGLLRRALLAVGERCAARGRLAAPEHVLEAESGEIALLLQGAGPSAPALAERAEERRRLSALPVPAVLGEPVPEPPLDALPAACAALVAGVLSYLALTDAEGAPLPAPLPDSAVLYGQGVGGGRYEGRARLALTPADFDRVEAGDVLVARTTSPAFNVLLPIVGAVVTDRGGLLCHTAIVAREFGLPAVVGTGEATARIPDGARLLVDGDRGLVEVRSDLAGGGAGGAP